MPKITIEKFYQTPTSFRYLEIKNLLLKNGCIERKAKGSHVKFKHSSFGKNNDLVIPVHNNDCKNFYKIKAAKMIYKYLK